MKYIFCIDEEIKDIQEGEINSIVDKQYVDILKIFVEKNSQKQTILEALGCIEEDEYIVFIPNNNLVISHPHYKDIVNIANLCKDQDIDYCRLKRIGLNGKTKQGEQLHKDDSKIFFQCPYIIKCSVLRKIISIPNDGPMFWKSLETGNFSGIFYYDRASNHIDGFSYPVPVVFHTLTEILTDDGKWSSSYINFNKKILKSKIEEYNIDIEDRGVDGYAHPERCCGQ
jgi:hypothetical protein